MYRIILCLFLTHIALKVDASSFDDVNDSSSVEEGMQNVVAINSGNFYGSGFVIRDDKNNRWILVTAYHVVKNLLEKPNDIRVVSNSFNELKIKKMVSYSKMLDTAFFELESYNRKGLKFSSSPDYNHKKVFILGAPSHKFYQFKGESFDHPAKNNFNIIVDDSFPTILSGFSGGPVLNENNEVIGMLSGGSNIYKNSIIVKSLYMERLLKFPKDKSFPSNQIPFFVYKLNNAFSGSDILLEVSNFIHLKRKNRQQGSLNAGKTLYGLAIGYGTNMLNMIVSSQVFFYGSNLMSYSYNNGNAEMLVLSSIITVGSVPVFSKMCSNIFKYNRNLYKTMKSGIK